jgi:protein TonB
MKLVYPPRYHQLGIEGDVKVEITINAEGQPTAVKILEPSVHAELNRSAENAAMRDDFIPAKKDGVPVEYKMTVVYRFRLK